jgi:hypothetical protein
MAILAAYLLVGIIGCTTLGIAYRMGARRTDAGNPLVIAALPVGLLFLTLPVAAAVGDVIRSFQMGTVFTVARASGHIVTVESAVNRLTGVQ